MANIALTSYVIGSAKDTIEEIHSVQLPDGRTPPQGLFTALYGARDTILALQDAQITARHKAVEEPGTTVFRVDMKLDAGETAAARTTQELAKEATFIHLGRLASDFESYLITRMWSGAETRTLNAIINDNPELLHKLFENTAVFGNLNAVVWQASFKRGEKLQMVTIKDTSKIQIKGMRGPFAENVKISY